MYFIAPKCGNFHILMANDPQNSEEWGYYNQHYAFYRRVTELTRRFAEVFLVFGSLPPAVAGDRAPVKSSRLQELDE
jgi:hypothetical protein